MSGGLPVPRMTADAPERRPPTYGAVPGATAVAPGEAAGIAPVGYLTKRFPRLSETFILDEILGLQAAGLPLRLYSIRDPHEPVVQPDAALVQGPVTYLRPEPAIGARARWLAGTLSSHARQAVAHPVRYPRTLLDAVRQRDRRAALSHFVDAGRLATLLDDAGAWHLHAAFAHGPAAIAHRVHQMTGRPFSFAGHAKDIYVSDPRQLARRAVEAEFVLVCSESARRELEAITGPSATRVHLVHHGVDTERFRPAGEARGTAPAPAPAPVAGRVADAPAPGVPGMDAQAPAPLRLLAAGRLVEKKGYPVLLEALAAVVASGRPVSCRIIGDGPLRAALAEQARALGIAEVVTFEGARSHAEVADAYRAADAFVQCSVVLADGDRDGVPNVVLEAMASGLPVVASDVAGIPEAVVDGETGFLVAPSEPAAVADRIGRLADDRALARRLGDAGRARAVARFDRRAAQRAVARLVAEATRAPRAGTARASDGRTPIADGQAPR